MQNAGVNPNRNQVTKLKDVSWLPRPTTGKYHKKETARVNSLCRSRHGHDGNTEALYCYGVV